MAPHLEKGASKLVTKCAPLAGARVGRCAISTFRNCFAQFLAFFFSDFFQT
jgi:hypothetical protein